MSDFNFFLPITKVDKERRQVSGYASTPAKDLDGEVVALEAVKAALPGYMEWRNVRAMHRPEAVGVAKEANVDDKGLFLTAKIVDDDAWSKCLEGVYKGFSIGGRKLAKNGDTITEIDLIEISVVDRPANPECRFEVQKRAKDAGEAYLVKLRAPRDPLAKAANQLGKAIATMAKAGDGFSSPAKVEKVLCEAHGKIDCEDCVEKREFSQGERDSAAASGAAEPDGSYPIKTKEDLHNAIQAFGRSKDKAKTKVHIIARARALGATDALPAKWAKKIAKKEAREAKKEVAKKAAIVAAVAAESAALPFLTLGADRSQHVAESSEGPGHEPFLKLKKGAKLAKRMSAVGTLSYCFDSLRGAQRDLLREAAQEGGDMKDKALAQRLGSVASELAGVIGQKADHEGREALDLSDADDQWVNQLLEGVMDMPKNATANADPLTKAILDTLKAAAEPSAKKRLDMAKSNLKKAKKSANDMEECIKAAHAMHKAAYLAKQALVKAGKKPADGDADDFDHAGAMEKLSKAFNSLSTMKTFMKAAGEQLKKAARTGQIGDGPGDANQWVRPLPGIVTDLSTSDLATASPGGPGRGSEPPIQSLESEFPGKVAKAFKGYISPEHAQAIAEAAAARAEANILKSLPASSGGSRPFAFDLTKMGNGTFADPAASTGLPAVAFKGVDVRALQSDDEETRKSAVGKAIGNMILGGGGRAIFDPSFHGTAGAGNGAN